jgi:glycosyltransferase involved in cell wall biosynthesis
VNIAYYSHYFTPEIGAPSARIYDLSRQWLAMGHRVQVVTCLPNHPTGRLYPGYTRRMYMRERIDGIDVHRHWTYITANRGFAKKTLGHVSYLPGAVCLSQRHLDPADAFIGTSPTFFAAMAAAAGARRFHAPFVMEVRDLWPAIFVDLGILRNRGVIRVLERLELALYRRATRVVTVTEAFRSNLTARGVPASKVVTIPNGADVEFWRPPTSTAAIRKRLGLEGRFVVLYIGALGVSQGLGQILDSAGKLREHEDIVFMVVGEGADKEALVDRARRERLANVTFLDAVDKDGVRELYAIADVCLVPLRRIPLFDSFIPSKMFEMMAMARPIVASVRGEAAEILERSRAAIVVEPEAGDAIAAAVAELHRDAARGRAMGEQGRRFVVEHYSRASLAERYVAVLEDAVAEHRRS